jgi:hypothetical protein
MEVDMSDSKGGQRDGLGMGDDVAWVETTGGAQLRWR